MGEQRVRLGLLKHIAHLEEEYPLRELSPLGIGGVADYFTVANTTIELASAIAGALETEIPYLVIGRGNHILVSDGGFPGLVIANQAMSLARAADKSQAVLDTGVEISRAVTTLASYGFGGLVPFYGQPGTVGSALYRNLQVNGQPLISQVRHVTVLMPPSKLKSEPTIVRHPGSWLLVDGESRLKSQKAQSSPFTPQPVLLTAVLQLTSNRNDELAGRIQQQASHIELPPRGCLGPLFLPLPDQEIKDVLSQSGATRLRVGGCTLLRRHPNYLEVRGKSVQARDARELIEQVQATVEQASGLQLQTQYEYVGVW